MLVYRVENSKGRGPYDCSSIAAIFVDPRKITKQSHPLPEEEGLELSPELYCGFSSEEQYTDWFHILVRRELHREGFLLRIFEVDDSLVQLGQRQLLFPRNKSRIKETRLLV